MMKTSYIFTGLCVLLLSCCKSQPQQENNAAPVNLSDEPHRPSFHFTPPSMWMNDPNGMVYHQGEYHLFYQHYPEGTVWGPMHWGHAISKDLVHWEHLPIALYPDSLGMIFSGSAVVDVQNTSGLGTKENPAMVAIFTYHHMEGEKAGKSDFQTQGIAFSLDKGRSWEKYAANPVLANTGISDFRDPKVLWYEEGQKWIMALAVYDHIRFYSSKDLKEWKLESSFGEGVGAHGGVWECPDLFEMQVDETGEKKWVLLVSINPGGPNKGSATQYFVGQFDGKDFVLDEQFKKDLEEESIIPKGRVLAGFEEDAYQDWQTSGDAFGAAPAQGAYFKQDRVNNYVGKKLANSFKTDQTATGSLISPSFTINSNFLNLMVGGRKDPEATLVRLVVDNETVRTASGNNSETLEWVSWDVQDLKGKKARIEVIDQSTALDGHILVDHIVLSDEPVNWLKREGIFIDYGTDNYAGVSWSGIPAEDGRRIFMGWMSNWLYAQVVPTENWRSAMTVARTLALGNTLAGLRISSRPVEELQRLHKTSYALEEQLVQETLSISEQLPFTTSTFELSLELLPENAAEGFVLELSNEQNEQLLIGYDPERKQYFVDRRNAGEANFSDEFAAIHYAPRLDTAAFSLRILVDVASIELFADGGKTVMTEIFFPREEMTNIQLKSGKSGLQLKEGRVTDLASIWEEAH